MHGLYLVIRYLYLIFYFLGGLYTANSGAHCVIACVEGFSGAELANVVNEASLLAARKDQEYITVLDLLEGVRRTK